MNINETLNIDALDSIANTIVEGIKATIKTANETVAQRKANMEKLDKLTNEFNNNSSNYGESTGFVLTDNGLKSIADLKPGDTIIGVGNMASEYDESNKECCGDCDMCNCDCYDEPITLKDIVSKVIFRNPYTIVHWYDGTITTVKAHGEDFDPEKGFAMAFTKWSFGNRYFRDMEKIIANSECEMTPFNREIAKANKKSKKAEAKKKASTGTDKTATIVEPVTESSTETTSKTTKSNTKKKSSSKKKSK